MFSIIKYTLLTASRDLLFLGLFVILFISGMVSTFLGSTAIVEQDLMTISYFAGSARFIVSIGLILFICFHVRRLFDNREIEVILSRPISRMQFILAYWLSFVILAILITVPLTMMIKLTTAAKSSGICFWGMSIVFETVIISAFAMLASLIMKSAVTSSLSTLSFYLLSRMMGFFMASVKTTPLYVPQFEHLAGWCGEWMMLLTSTVFPRFDLFAKTSWLIYGEVSLQDFTLVSVQAAIYIPLLLFAAIIDFKNKQF